MQSHNELVIRASKWLQNTRKMKVVFAEITTGAQCIPDAIGFGRGRSELVEVKVSRSDFRRDRDKISHRTNKILGTYCWYVTPMGLLHPEEVPEWWGLVEVGARSCTIAKQATLNPHRHFYGEIEILASACRRHQLGVEWKPEQYRFAPYSEFKK